ncbi:MAG TPA: class I SAM-dependent methyltransferase [Gemmatimonadaceae bacterium]|nr:class I SAM-dependent methyltransferase [Gemmatimonadaceae bacterium]
MSRLMAALYDPVLRIVERRGLRQWRRETLAVLSGRVLEIGAGTGRNLPFYPEAVTELALLEPDAHMRAQLSPRAARASRRLTIHDGDAAALPFPDGAFDAVVVTLVLCTIPDVPGALAEARRVLAPHGTLVFIEHVGAVEGSRRRRWQRRLEPAWRRVAGGCRLTRDTLRAIADAGFTVRRVDASDLPGLMRLGSPVVRGVAQRGSPDDR